MSMEIEKAILGFMLVDESLNSGLLNSSLFSHEQHKQIFNKIRDMRSRGEFCDPITLGNALTPNVARSYIISLPDGLYGIRTRTAEYTFRAYVDKLIKINKEREAKELIAQSINEPDFIPRLQELLSNYTPEETRPIEDFTMAAHVDSFKDFVQKKRDREIWGLEIKSFPRLTRALMGLREITVLTAEAKTGKSTLALQIASEIADQGIGVIYYDFENGHLNLMARELCRKHSIKYGDIFRQLGSRDEIERAISEFNKRGNFAIITDRKLTLDKIRGHISWMKQKTGHDEVLMVIDSLQKLPMENLRERRAAVDKWLRAFEELKADDPHLTIFMVSEEARGTGLPKESGDIEYTGHFLLKLTYALSKEEIKEYGGDSGERFLHLQYARDVKAGGEFKYKADFEYWKFEEIERHSGFEK